MTRRGMMAALLGAVTLTGAFGALGLAVLVLAGRDVGPVGRFVVAGALLAFAGRWALDALDVALRGLDARGGYPPPWLD